MGDGFGVTPAIDEAERCPKHDVPLEQRRMPRNVASFVPSATGDRDKRYCPRCEQEGGDARAR